MSKIAEGQHQCAPSTARSHLVERIGWLRAAVLGANDGIISTASLILGVAAARLLKAIFCLRVLRVSWLAPCPWRPESMFRSALNPILSRPISRERAGAFGRSRVREKGTGANLCRSWLGTSTGTAGRAPAYGQGCIRRACSRRARNVGDYVRQGPSRRLSHQRQRSRLEQWRLSLSSCSHRQPY